jgi:ElaB/YqjD/DUF883 family membrane-anchored ribosome-binding protein
MMATEISRRVEQLRHDIRFLLKRARRTLQSSVAHTRDVVGDVGERIHEGMEKMSDTWSLTKQGVADGAERADKAIRSHPYRSLAVGISIGMIAGILLSKQRRR